MIGKYILIGLILGAFFAGLGIGYSLFINTYNPYAMMGNSIMFSQMMGKNPQFSGQYMGYMMQNPQYMNQWMGSMMQDPQLRQQMYNYMLQNQDFMYQMMKNSTFQNNYMGPWMMQNNFTYHGMMWKR